MKALVTGGGGFLGRAIVEQLIARGDEVTILSRSRYPEVEALGARGIAWDLSQEKEGLEEAVGPQDVIFHVAAKAGVWGPRESFWSINVAGTRRMLELAEALGVQRFVYTSSPSVTFQGHDEAGVREADCHYPKEWLAIYPESKAAAEKLVLEAHGQNLATVSLRPHLIWGPRDPHLLPRVISRRKQGRLVMVGSGQNKVGLTYVDNAAAAHLQAADRLGPDAPHGGKAYFITDLEPVQLWPWINGFLGSVGLAPVTRRLPLPVARFAGGLMEWVWRTFDRAGEPPLTRFVAAQLATDHWYDLTGAREDFGYTPVVDPAEGLVRATAFFKDRVQKL